MRLSGMIMIGCFAILCIWQWGISWQAADVFAFLAVLWSIAFVDRKRKKIPDALVLTLMALGILSIPLFQEPNLPQRILGVLSVSSLMFFIILIVPGAFGGGDIKLMAACGLFLGWEQNLQAFAIAVLAAGIYCSCMLAAGKINRRSKIAFGPFLCLGVAVCTCLI